MITIIIPTLNEEKTIANAVKFAKANRLVSEVIVVDDKSVDNTVNEAKHAGADIITSTKIGKGASMRDGLLVAKGDIIVYIDGDIDSFPPKTIEKITLPLLNNEADFVKATFKREAGRVTELVAKPLLSLMFPEISHFSQPLSGIIAGKKDVFKNVTFEDDYGVDIGILIDVALSAYRIVEIDIGELHHKMKQWQELGRMSKEVARTILKRATKSSLMNLDSLETINIIRDQMTYAIRETLLSFKKMAIFDMDNTILKGRFIEVSAILFGFENELSDIMAKHSGSFVRSKSIAKLFEGKNISQLLAVTDSIPLIHDVLDVVGELKKRGYVVGIISDSYDCIANHIKTRIGADFALANELVFSESRATGEVMIPSFFLPREGSRCNHNFCKSNAMTQIADKYNIEFANIVAIGDSDNDICMVKNAGIGVSFCSSNNILNSIADYCIETRSFKPILDFAE